MFYKQVSPGQITKSLVKSQANLGSVEMMVLATAMRDFDRAQQGGETPGGWPV
jgi:hypothetical protein